MFDCILESGNQALILGEVVGLVAEVLAAGGNFVPGLVLDHDAISGRARVSAGSAVAVRDKIVSWRLRAGRWEKISNRG
jgi:hypothetical protein